MEVLVRNGGIPGFDAMRRRWLGRRGRWRLVLRFEYGSGGGFRVYFAAAKKKDW